MYTAKSTLVFLRVCLLLIRFFFQAVSALKQLHKLNEELQRQKSFTYRPFAQFGSSRETNSGPGPSSSARHTEAADATAFAPTTPASSKMVLASTSSVSKSCNQSPTSRGTKRPLCQVVQDSSSVKKKQRRTSPNMFDSLIGSGNAGTSSEPEASRVVKKIEFGENSNSWADVGPLYIGTYSLKPLTITMKQRLLLQFLTPLAEYQEVGYSRY